MTVNYARQKVLDAMATKVTSITVGASYNHSYRFVTSDPLGDENIAKLQFGEACVGIYDTAEQKRRLMGFTDATLTVVVEFYYFPKVGEAKSNKLNEILAELTKALTADQTLSGTALMIEDVSNQLDIDGIYDKIINGSITFHVTYRHGLFDPTSLYLN